jgi:hypothetical protein
MPAVRKRCKKIVRKRYKKTIKLSKVDAVWKDWVEIMIIEPLIKDGKVQVDKNFSLEIVGRRVIDDERAFNLFKNGLIAIRGGGVKKSGMMNRTRDGLIYRIVAEDKKFKNGKLIFEALPKIKKRVSEAFKNTNTYYRIEQ